MRLELSRSTAFLVTRKSSIIGAEGSLGKVPVNLLLSTLKNRKSGNRTSSDGIVPLNDALISNKPVQILPIALNNGPLIVPDRAIFSIHSDGPIESQ